MSTSKKIFILLNVIFFIIFLFHIKSKNIKGLDNKQSLIMILKNIILIKLFY